MIKLVRLLQARQLLRTTALKASSTNLEPKQFPISKTSTTSMRLYFNNWPDNSRRDYEELHQQFDTARPSEVKAILFMIEKTSSADKIYSTVSYLIQRKLVKSSDVPMILKLLGQAYMEKPPSSRDLEVYRTLEELISKTGLFASSSQCLYNILMGEDVKGFGEYGMLKRICFNALVVQKIRSNDLEGFKQVLDHFKMDKLCLYEDSHLFSQYKQRLEVGGVPWLVPFLKQFEVSNVLMEDYSAIRQAVDSARAKVRISKVTGDVCGVCKKTLPTLKRTEDGFTELKNTLYNHLQKAVEQNRVGNIKDFNRLLGLIKAIQKDYKGQMPTKKCIVVDVLNILSGLYTSNRPGVVGFLMKLKDEYEEVVLMMRKNVLADYTPRLRGYGLRVVEVARDSDDDTFAIMAALLINNQCYVMSNDRFGLTKTILHNIGNEKAEKEFERFIVTRVIGYDREKIQQAPPLPVQLKMKLNEDESRAHFVLIGNSIVNQQQLYCVELNRRSDRV
ncbi:unnamed protein product [Bursaphelenchus okinawaensis]|uniref:PRORP domain-containing protein n=1 Tax=Bursaphelenchus okinawaensis TaxID=465554 RepID=A0A811KRE6_9BILA|nr:unnamed protein product [Bursaphelenchus okinawaensis]CAG9109805.1 unnamed protein product [Bursaphelenchus okinawaensis]